MDASELRVGNLLHYKEDVVTLCGINPSECFVIRDKDLIMTGIDNLKPIPLTEEILLKFGFEYRKKNSKVIMLDLTNEEFETTLQNWITTNFFQICRSGINALSVEIKYVHQLQNLYFALTSEELQLK